MNTNHVFSAFSCIAFILATIPLPWHFEAWNTGTCAFMFWVAVSALASFVNSIVWDGNVVDWSPGWCDITTRIILGTNVGIPAASLCIQRRLYYIISDPVVIVTKAEKRRSVMIDSLIGLGIPFLNIILTYVVQGHRYDIFEDVGCYPAILNTALTFVLISIWPIVIGLISGVYCFLNIYHLCKKRRSAGSLFEASTGSVNISRYLRLMCVSGIELLSVIPLGVWSLYLQMTLSPVIPWPGWAAAHANFSRVDQIPAAIWRSDHNAVVSLELTRWSSVMCAIIFFAFFGFADEARRHYSLALKSIAKKTGYSTFSPDLSNSYGVRTSKTLGRRRMSELSLDEFALPVYEKDLESSETPKKLDPYGAAYGSAITISTNCDTDSKHDHSSGGSSPVLPNIISPPPPSLGRDQRNGLRPPVMKTPF